jgi:hypothetical protein
MLKGRTAICLFLIALMLLSLAAGCSRTPTTTTTRATTTAGATTGTTMPTTTAKQTIRISATYAYTPNAFTDTQNNLVRQEILAKTGVDIEYVAWHISNVDEYRRQLNVWAASSELPTDVIRVSSDAYTVTLLNSMGDNGILMEIEDIVSAYTDFMAYCGHTFPRYRSKDTGKLYGYPTNITRFEDYNIPDNGFSMRKDYLQQIGRGIPKNPSELYDILKELKATVKTPDGKDIIPLVLGENMRFIGNIGNQFLGLWGEFWLKNSSGTYVIPMYSDVERMKNFIVFMNTLYREGLLDQEAFTIKQAQFIERCTTGVAAATPSLNIREMTQSNDILNQTKPDAMFVMIPAFPNNDVSKVYGLTTNPWGNGIAVFNKKTMTEDKLRAWVEVAEWMLTKEGTIITKMGVENTHWEFDSAGKAVYTAAFQEKSKGNQDVWFAEGLWVYQALIAGNWFRINEYSTTDPTLLRPDVMESMRTLEMLWAQTDTVFGVYPGEVEQLKMDGLRTAWQQTFINAVLAGSADEARSLYDKWPEIARNMGYAEIIEERNKLVNALK